MPVRKLGDGDGRVAREGRQVREEKMIRGSPNTPGMADEGSNSEAQAGTDLRVRLLMATSVDPVRGDGDAVCDG